MLGADYSAHTEIRNPLQYNSVDHSQKKFKKAGIGQSQQMIDKKTCRKNA
ncbi:hypothetical protein M272_15960 [Vibrio natriegens NBRC 15636 = ATCC 14048 = DSM 759]|nr:hypothetical protein M272_15960 [Vibrio natriegens NBRC 15636 = ATCC 14048 = DSM 759]